MKSNDEIPQYLLIRNPFTGKSVNVLPLFALLQEAFVAESGSLANFIMPLQHMQDFVNTEMHLDEYSEDNFVELAALNYNIVRLRKMFEKMEEKV